MNPKLAVLMALVGGGCLVAGFAAAATPDAQTRASALGIELSKTKLAFYAEFNRVNTDPEYVTHCRVRSRFESHILAQVCTPQFLDNATAAEGQWALGRLSGFYGADYGVPFAPSANEAIRSKMPGYRSRVHELARQDSKLAQIASDYQALRKQFEAVRKTT
jgi:outer membrane murein-binding lipoprotein Lpp